VLLQQAAHQRAVGDVALHEDVARIVAQRLEVAQAAGIGELVQVDDRLAGGGDRRLHEVGPDKACATRD